MSNEYWIVYLQGFYNSPPAEGREEVFARPRGREVGRASCGRRSMKYKGATITIFERSWKTASRIEAQVCFQVASGAYKHLRAGSLPLLFITLITKPNVGHAVGAPEIFAEWWMSQPINQLWERSFIQKLLWVRCCTRFSCLLVKWFISPHFPQSHADDRLILLYLKE